MATLKGFYLVKNNMFAWLSFGPYSGVGLCSGGPLMRGFTVYLIFTVIGRLTFHVQRVLGYWWD